MPIFWWNGATFPVNSPRNRETDPPITETGLLATTCNVSFFSAIMTGLRTDDSPEWPRSSGGGNHALRDHDAGAFSGGGAGGRAVPGDVGTGAARRAARLRFARQGIALLEPPLAGSTADPVPGPRRGRGAELAADHRRAVVAAAQALGRRRAGRYPRHHHRRQGGVRLRRGLPGRGIQRPSARGGESGGGASRRIWRPSSGSGAGNR